MAANLAALMKDATGVRTLRFALMLTSQLLAFWLTHALMSPTTMVANVVLMVVPLLEECSWLLVLLSWVVVLMLSTDTRVERVVLTIS